MRLIICAFWKTGGLRFDLSNPKPVQFTIICVELPTRQNLRMYADVRAGKGRNIYIMLEINYESDAFTDKILKFPNVIRKG